ncbi:MAG: cytochrome o ubiquinol oxidase subunit III [Candidatus Doudnabacteria bacterium]
MDEHEKNDKLKLGFWVYLMTDLIMFAVLFAAFAVLRGNTFGGASAKELLSLPGALANTLILLTSSFTCGLAILAVAKKDKIGTQISLGVTFVLGLTFLILELNEFSKLVADGNSWQRSAFLSSFFTLVGTHGLHITVGLLCIIISMIMIWRRGLTPSISGKLVRLSLFWHFLDVVWIFIFTIVYLMGTIK